MKVAASFLLLAGCILFFLPCQLLEWDCCGSLMNPMLNECEVVGDGSKGDSPFQTVHWSVGFWTWVRRFTWGCTVFLAPRDLPHPWQGWLVFPGCCWIASRCSLLWLIGFGFWCSLHEDVGPSSCPAVLRQLTQLCIWSGDWRRAGMVELVPDS